MRTVRAINYQWMLSVLGAIGVTIMLCRATDLGWLQIALEAFLVATVCGVIGGFIDAITQP